MGAPPGEPREKNHEEDDNKRENNIFCFHVGALVPCVYCRANKPPIENWAAGCATFRGVYADRVLLHVIRGPLGARSGMNRPRRSTAVPAPYLGDPTSDVKHAQRYQHGA